MPYKTMTYRHIATILKAIGFKEKRMKAAHIVFSHPKSNAVILLPYYTSKMIIPDPHLAMIKRTIIEKGILSEEAWYEVLQAGEENVFATHKEQAFA